MAIPSIFAGLRLGLIYALLGVVTSEIVASTSGLGNLVQTYSNTYNLAGVYGILLVLAAGAHCGGAFTLALPLLVEHLNGTDEALRSPAVRGLTQLDTKAAREALWRARGNGHAEARAEARDRLTKRAGDRLRRR